LRTNCPQAEPKRAQPQPEPQPDGKPQPYEPPEVDDSVVWQSIPEDYKIELLSQYEKPYLVKIVRYQHGQIEQLREQVKQLNDEDARRRATVLNQQDEIMRLRVQLRKSNIGVVTSAAEA
jgi:hypothetical protein